MRLRFDGILIILATVAVALLALSYFRPSTFLPSTSTAGSPPPPTKDAAILVGKRLPNVVISSRDGSEGVFSFQSSGYQLAIAFRPDCSQCEYTVAEWRDLLAAVSLHHVRTLAISPQSEVDNVAWLSERALDPDVILNLANPADIVEVLGLTAVPATLVLDSAGTVTRIHYGSLMVDDVRRLDTLVRASTNSNMEGAFVRQ